VGALAVKTREESVKKWQDKLRSKQLARMKRGQFPKNKQSRYAKLAETARRKKIKEWKDSGERCECSVIGCDNIPGQDGFPIQWDHIVPRGDSRELVFDSKNTRVTCGSHNDLDFANGVRVQKEERLIKIKKYFGQDAYDYAWEFYCGESE